MRKEDKSIKVCTYLDKKDYNDFIEYIDWGKDATGNISEAIRLLIRKALREWKIEQTNPEQG